MKGVTARNAFHRQPAAAHQAKSVNRLDRILGAGRLIAACRRQAGRHKTLIKTNRSERKIFHRVNSHPLFQHLPAFEQLRDGLHQLGERSLANAFASNQDQVIAGFQLRQIRLKGLTEAALGVIAPHRIAQLFPGDHCRARPFQAVAAQAQYDKRVGKCASFLPHPLYIGFIFETPRAFHAKSAELRLAEHFGALDAHRKPRAPFGAASFEHIPPAGRAHLFAKAVHAQAMHTLGLIGSFHVVILPGRDTRLAPCPEITPNL